MRTRWLMWKVERDVARRGESCAIDANKWLLSTRVQVVKCLGQHLLAGSGFPKKDDGRVCESDRFHELDYLAE